MTLDRDTTQEEIDYAVDSLVGIIKYLREMSPLYEDYKQGRYESIIEGYKSSGMKYVN